LGVEAHRGDLSDTGSLAAAARAREGVIHTAFIHDFSAYAAAVETDRRAAACAAVSYASRRRCMATATTDSYPC